MAIKITIQAYPALATPKFNQKRDKRKARLTLAANYICFLHKTAYLIRLQ